MRTHWKSNNEETFYEAFKPACKRAQMGEIVRGVETRRFGRASVEEKDTLGNIMVASTQELSGLN